MEITKSQFEEVLLLSIKNSKKLNLKIALFLLLVSGLGIVFISYDWGFYTFCISAGLLILLVPLLFLFSWFNSKSYRALISLMNESPEKIIWAYSLTQTANSVTTIYLSVHTNERAEIRIEENDLIRQGISIDAVFGLLLDINPDCQIGYSEKLRAYFSNRNLLHA